MGTLDEHDVAQIHVTAAHVKRAMEDVQSLYCIQKQMEATLRHNNEACVAVHQKVVSLEGAVEDLLDDKKSLFRWVMAGIGAFVLVASLVALNLPIPGV